MKNKVYLLLIAIIASNSVFSQLKVETSGNVKLTKNMAVGTTTQSYIGLNLLEISRTTTPCYGIQSIAQTYTSMPTSSLYGVYGFADSSPLTIGNQSLGPIVGVFGKSVITTYTSNNFSAGVAGMGHYYGGIGVYGGIGSGNLTLPTSSLGGPYAGYFAGNVKVAATLTAAAVTTTSDARLKDDIQYISNSTIELIAQLRPITYKFKHDSTQYVYMKESQEKEVYHYGLVAQDVQQVLPNIVYQGGDGYLSVNYTELVPILVKTVQELSDEVKKLRAILIQQNN